MAANARNAELSAVRMQRLRERRRKGMRCFQLEIRKTEIDNLVKRMFLKPDDRSNYEAVRQALYRFLDQNLS